MPMVAANVKASAGAMAAVCRNVLSRGVGGVTFLREIIYEKKKRNLSFSPCLVNTVLVENESGRAW